MFKFKIERKDMEDMLQKMLISYIREKFQTPSERKALMGLMVKEINMSQMRDKQEIVPFRDSVDTFLLEVDQVVKDFDKLDLEREKEKK